MPVTATPSSLDSHALALRLSDLAGEEREVQVDFLLYSAEFDARRAFVDAGFPSLWAYCLEVLHLREGAAGRRIGAMRVVVRFPGLEGALRPELIPAQEVAMSRPRRPAELQPVAADQWSLRVTLDRALKEDLETLRCLLAHKVPDGDLSKLLHEAVRCAVEKHGRRRGAVAPARKSQRSTTAERKTREPSTEVKRAVWERDGGRCTFVAGDGRRCESRWKLEYDHIDEEKPATVANTRLRCRPHNILHAEETYGRARMDLFRRDRAAGADEKL